MVAISPADKLGETLAAFLLSGYLGLSLPAIAVGVALQCIPARVALLTFAIIASVAILACGRVLLGGAHISSGEPTDGERRS